MFFLQKGAYECRPWFLALVLGLALALGVQLSAQPTQNLPLRFSLKESIRYALEHNLSHKDAILVGEETRPRINQVLSEGLPKIRASVEYDYNFAVRTVFLPDFVSPIVYNVLADENLLPRQPRNFGVAPASFGTEHTASAGLVFEQLVFDMRYFVSLQASKLLSKIAKKDLVQSELNLVENMHQSYYLFLIAKRRLTLAEQNKERLTSLFEQTQLRYENGFVERTDLDQIQVSLNQLEVEVSRALSAVEVSRRLLNLQMGLPLSHPIQASDSLHLLSLEVPVDRSFDPSDRVIYQRVTLAESLAQVDYKSELAKYAPKLLLVSSIGYNAGTNTFGDLFNNEWFPYGAIGVRLRIPIFEGLNTTSAWQLKKIQWSRTKNQRSLLSNQLQQEQLGARSNYENRRAALEVQKKNLRLATTVYERIKEKYNQGISSNLEVVSASTTLKEVQTQYDVALYEALLARLAVQKSEGRLATP